MGRKGDSSLFDFIQRSNQQKSTFVFLQIMKHLKKCVFLVSIFIPVFLLDCFFSLLLGEHSLSGSPTPELHVLNSPPPLESPKPVSDQPEKQKTIELFDVPAQKLDLLTYYKDTYTLVFMRGDTPLEVQYKGDRILSLALSPMKNRVAVLYEQENKDGIVWNLQVFSIEHRMYQSEYFDVFDDGYFGEGPLWLGNDFIYYTQGHCSGCQDTRLVNITSKQMWYGLLDYTVGEDDREQLQMYFDDWFGTTHKFVGNCPFPLAEMKNGKTYLVFKMTGKNDEELPEHRFLFTGQSLVPVK